LLAEGAADCYPRLAPTSQWATPAAQGVRGGAGGEGLNMQGQPFRYPARENFPTPHFLPLPAEAERGRSLLDLARWRGPPGLWRQGAPRLAPGAGDHAVADLLGVDDLLATAVAYPHDVSLAPVGQGLPQGAGLDAILAGDDGHRLAPAHPQGGVQQVGGER